MRRIRAGHRRGSPGVRQAVRLALNGLAAVVLCAFTGLPAQAQDAQPASPGWSFQVTSYLWLAGINSTATTARGFSASSSQSFGEILSNLDAGLMILGDARYGRWGLLADVDYAKLTADGGRPGPLLGQPSITTRSITATVDGGYRFIDSESVKLDGLLGVRIFSINSTISFSGGQLPPLSDSSGTTWADPLLGARVILPIGGGFFANALADIGGGVAGDLTWQAYGGLGYNINKTFAAYLGYRYLAYDHSIGRLAIDSSEQGPLIGVGIRF